MTETFDKQELLEELDGDREFLEESLAILDADAPQLLVKIHEALELGDTESIANSAHTFKSMVGNFCAEPAQQAALDLETKGRNGDLASCRISVVLLDQAAKQLQQALHKLLDEFE
jgi:HPt (histidine-containing phosphotransfer) domain-containing protein